MELIQMERYLKLGADLMTIVAVIIGAVWTIYVMRTRRAHEVRASLQHRVHVWRHASGLILRFEVILRNCGEVTIDPGVAYTSVQLPPEQIDASTSADRTWREVEKISHPWKEDRVRIDPGEDQQYAYDVRLPTDAAFVQVTTVVKCTDKRDDQLRWDLTTIVDVGAALQQAAPPSLPEAPIRAA